MSQAASMLGENDAESRCFYQGNDAVLAAVFTLQQHLSEVHNQAAE